MYMYSFGVFLVTILPYFVTSLFCLRYCVICFASSVNIEQHSLTDVTETRIENYDFVYKAC